MGSVGMIRMQISQLVMEARNDLYLLSSLSDASRMPLIIQRLWERLSSIHFLSELLANQAMTADQLLSLQGVNPVSSGNPIQSHTTGLSAPSISNQRNFTSAELATYTGKNGRPAYVAVNGIVYDVTSNRAWAAASHFGLVAGKEYTQEFASCHAGQQSILAALPVAGRLS